MDANELKTILELRKEWLDCETGGASANLRGANLRSAKLQDATLDGANLLTKPVITLCLDYWILITQFEIRVGGERFSHAEFIAVTLEEARKIDGEKAVEFLKTYKPMLVEVLKTYEEK